MGAFGPGFGPNFDHGAATQGKAGGPGGGVVFEKYEGRVVSRGITVVGLRRATMLKASPTVRVEASSSLPVQEIIPIRRSGGVRTDRSIIIIGETKARLKSVRYGAMRQAAKMEKIVRRVKLLDLFFSAPTQDEPEIHKVKRKKKEVDYDRIEHFKQYVGSATRRSDEPAIEDSEN